MKRSLFSILALILLIACQEVELVPDRESNGNIYASIEQLSATKTSMDTYGNVRWSSGDQIAAFIQSTYARKYQILSDYVGETTGGFSEVAASTGGVLVTGNQLEHNILFYPYSTSVKCEKHNLVDQTQYYELNVTLPETQHYAEDTFGNGSFPMVAVAAKDDIFTFKNICGGISLQFKGVDRIKSIKLEGRANEKLSGKASVFANAKGTPSIEMSSSADTYVLLDCGDDGVQLNETTPTTFIIALPPMIFGSGIKITVTDTDGLSKTLTNTSSNTIKRSSLLTFPEITYTQVGYMELPDAEEPIPAVPATGGEVIVPLKTNQTYSVQIPDGAKEWIHVDAETKGIREENIKFIISPNNTSNPRSAIVAIITSTEAFSIEITQDARTSTANDYVDESGVNHGPGVEIDGVIWAPVNCGYHETDYPYGKLYQWGRRFGQGDPESYNVAIVEGPVTLSEGQSVDNADCLFKSSTNNWLSDPDAQLWNQGSSEEPIKTEYDPCPDGWRVPTGIELESLFKNSSSSLYVGGRGGRWFSGSATYTDSEARVFLPMAGYVSGWSGNFMMDNQLGTYWSSSTIDERPSCYEFSQNTMYVKGLCADAKSVRCVYDETSLSDPSLSEAVNLSQEGTANSYIVSAVGTYEFTPTKGNSNESAGTIASVEVLWETFGTDVAPAVGDLIRNVHYENENNRIVFETPATFKEGNAVIAAKNSFGTILWSWHIWLTDKPQEHVYKNNAGTMMDRNLGATSATPGEIETHGLFYQWGRKDPFLGAAEIKTSDGLSVPQMQKSTLEEWPSATQSSSDRGTISYAIQNPTKFIYGVSYTNNDWLYQSRNNDLWDSQKTIYDPCPVGWRVPVGGSRGADGVWSLADFSNASYDTTYEGVNFSISNSSTTWYPSSGYYSSDGYSAGKLYGVGYVGYYWSASPSSPYSYSLYISNSGVSDVSENNRSYGYSVRCFKEGTGGGPSVTPPAETKDGDYIDDEGNNYGQGVEIDGVVWAPVNVGAESTAKYGDYLTWMEAHNACPDGWRLPSKSEFESLIGNSSWDTVDGVNGRWMYGSSQTQNSDCSIFLPAAGDKNGNIGHDYAGYYWTMNSGTSPSYVSVMKFTERENPSISYNFGQNQPITVRCVQVSKSESAASEVTVDGLTWKTKNLGATSISEIGNHYKVSQSSSVCPDGWRIPTIHEYTSLHQNCRWDIVDGVSGYWMFGNNMTSNTSNAVFLPSVHYWYDGNDGIKRKTDKSVYMASTNDAFTFTDATFGTMSLTDSYHFVPIRCVKGTLILPYIETYGKTVNFDYEGKTPIKVSFESNLTEFDVVIPEKDKAWVEASVSGLSVTINVAENLGYERYSTLKIVAKNNTDIYDEIIVTQEGMVEFDPNHCIYYRANLTGGWDEGNNNYRDMESHIKADAGGVTMEMKFKLNPLSGNDEAYLGSGSNTERDSCNEFYISNNALNLYLYYDEDNDLYKKWKFSDIGVSYTDLITLRLSCEDDTITINDTIIECDGLESFKWTYLFSTYYRDYDEGEWRQYDGVPDGSALYYVKMYDSAGNMTYIGHAAKAKNPDTGNMEYCWYSNNNGTISCQFANDSKNQGGYTANF